MFDNYLMNIMVLSWVSAQVLKTIINYFGTKEFVAERLIGAGGMPSSHSALVCALALGTARKVGASDPMFAIAFALAAIVMYDAMGVRRAAGEQAKVINKMLSGFKKHENNFWDELVNSIEQEEDEDISEEVEEETQNKKLKEYIGHTPMEVLGGALLGILIAIIMPVT